MKDDRAAGPRSGDPADAVLGPATRLLWRTHDAVHLEFAGRAIIVERLPRPVIDRLASSAPPFTRPRPIAPDVGDALAELISDGVLWRRPSGPEDTRLTPPSPRLTGELTALTTRHGDRAADVLTQRAKSSVVVHGPPRVATHLAALLAAAGVGRVRCVSDGTARLLHASPGGISPGDEGRPLDDAVHDALERAAPEVDTTPLPLDEGPDLTVLVLDGPMDQGRRATLHSDGAAHLAVTTVPHGGVVGPLVLPGLTGCLGCADLHRRERDPSWSALAAQLTVPRRHGSSCDAATEAVVTGVAAGQALAFLDGDDLAGIASVDGTLEVHPPDWRVRRRTWPTHPACDCGGSLHSAGGGGDWAH